MNKQLTWFLVAIIWAMVAVINSVQHRSPYLVTYNVLAAILFAALGLLRSYCRKRGSEGKKMFNRIALIATGLLLLLVGLFLR